MPERSLVVGMMMVVLSAGPLIHPADAGEKPAPKQSEANAGAAKKKPQITDIIIRGSERMSAEQVKARMRSQVGKEFSSATLDEDVHELYKTRRFSKIQIVSEPDGPGRIKLYVLLCDLPDVVTKVTYQGAKHLKEEDLSIATGVRVGRPFNRYLNRAGCQRILELYQEKGRPFTTCELIKGGQLGDTEVIYHIVEGPKTVIRDIRFTGNSFVSDAQLTTKIHSARRWLHSYCTGEYDRRMAEADVNELIKFYKAFGYKDVRVSLETKPDADGRDITLIFHIQEGPRYRITTQPEIVAPKGMATERLGKLVQMKKGDYLTEAAIKDDVRRIQDYCESQHQTILIKPNLVWMTDQPGVAQVQYEIEKETPTRGQQGSSEPSSEEPRDHSQTDTGVKQPLARIGQIFLTGNKRVSSESILAHIPLFPGQVLTYPDLQKAENALAELGLFVVDPEAGIKPTITVLDSGNGSSYKDLLITVKEKRVPRNGR